MVKRLARIFVLLFVALFLVYCAPVTAGQTLVKDHTKSGQVTTDLLEYKRECIGIGGHAIIIVKNENVEEVLTAVRRNSYSMIHKEPCTAPKYTQTHTVLRFEYNPEGDEQLLAVSDGFIGGGAVGLLGLTGGPIKGGLAGTLTLYIRQLLIDIRS